MKKVVRVAIERGLRRLEKIFEKFFVRRTDLGRKNEMAYERQNTSGHNGPRFR